MVKILKTIRKKLFFLFLILSTILYSIFLHKISRFEDETEADVNSKTFLMEDSSHNRTLFDIETIVSHVESSHSP